MKTPLSIRLSVVALMVVMFPVLTCVAAGSFGVGARLHADHSVFTELPFDDGDLSYALTCEFHDKNAYWQLGVSYAPAPGTNGTDFVVTPQLNLIVKDRYWRAGIGILDSYIEMDNGENDWTDVYFQFLTGLHMPLFGMEFDVFAYYPFGDWGDISDFDFDDLDYGGCLTFPF